MALVALDVAKFALLYPGYATVTEPELQAYLLKAGLYLNNTDNSIVSNIIERELLLYMIMAHLIHLSGASCGSGGMVGRISSASEGSVSASADYITPTSGMMAWFLQTPYGAEYWAVTQKYRSFSYSPTRRLRF